MEQAERQLARLAGLWSYHVTTQKQEIRTRLMTAPGNRIAITITEDHRARWAAAEQMIEAGELILLKEVRCATRRGPPRPDGTRRVRREMRVSLADWDPIEKRFTYEEDEPEAEPAQAPVPAPARVTIADDEERI